VIEETSPVEFRQGTLADILDSEKEMILTAPQRYGEYYDHAFACSMFLTQFLKSIDSDRYVAASFFAQVKKHHTLALFSTVRLHKVQSMIGGCTRRRQGSSPFACRSGDIPSSGS
jgi:hypothetical protein